MGTDIHLAVEVDAYRGNADKPDWFLLSAPAEKCYMCGGEGVIISSKMKNRKKEWLEENDGKPCRTCAAPMHLSDDGKYAWQTYRYVGVPGYHVGRWYDDRNYAVFAVLANVRNGRGFAGIFTHIPIEPIDDPRGFPEDMSAETEAWFTQFGGDHSDTWLMLDEVLGYPWDQPLYRSGVMDMEDWAAYRRGERFGWAGDISGSMVRKITNAEMDKKLSECTLNEHGRLVHPDGLTYTTQLAWEDTLLNSCEHFVNRMKELKALVGDAPTRLVFNFDS